MPVRNPQRILGLAGALVMVALAGAQFVPVSRTNPPPGSAIDPPADVHAILTRSCFDCHSNGTRWPWYSHVAPMSWLVTNHVHEGRSNLNFSYWGDLAIEERRKLAKDVVDQIAAGAMPLRPYLLIHRDARLSTEEARILTDWFSRPPPESGSPVDPAAGAGGRSWQGDALYK